MWHSNRSKVKVTQTRQVVPGQTSSSRNDCTRFIPHSSLTKPHRKEFLVFATFSLGLLDTSDWAVPVFMPSSTQHWGSHAF